jgi:hypothetical protein
MDIVRKQNKISGAKYYFAILCLFQTSILEVFLCIIHTIILKQIYSFIYFKGWYDHIYEEF